jgi:hypothetical protein
MITSEQIGLSLQNCCFAGFGTLETDIFGNFYSLDSDLGYTITYQTGMRRWNALHYSSFM